MVDCLPLPLVDGAPSQPVITFPVMCQLHTIHTPSCERTPGRRLTFISFFIRIYCLRSKILHVQSNYSDTFGTPQGLRTLSVSLPMSTHLRLLTCARIFFSPLRRSRPGPPPLTRSCAGPHPPTPRSQTRARPPPLRRLV